MTLDEIQSRADAATKGPWKARTTGRAGGDHWYVCDAGESIASIHASDGEDEDEREHDAVFIAAARTDVEKLCAALRAVEAVHRPFTVHPSGIGTKYCVHCWGSDGSKEWPCPTITAIREALNG